MIPPLQKALFYVSYSVYYYWSSLIGLAQALGLSAP